MHTYKLVLIAVLLLAEVVVAAVASGLVPYLARSWALPAPVQAPQAAATLTPTATPAMAAAPTPTVPQVLIVLPPVPTPAQGRQSAAAPTPSPSPPVRMIVANTNGLGVNIRREPSSGAERVTSVLEGTVLTVVGTPTTTEGRTWRPVRDPAGNSGWVPEDFLTPAQ